MGTCDALLDIFCAGHLELDRGGELALVQIDFSAAFDRVNHGGLVFKLREAGVGSLILKMFQNFLSSRTQRVKVDGVCSSSIDVVSGVPQGSVLGPLMFLLYIADLPRLLQNELVGYADDSTLLCKIPHPRDRSSVAASLNDDLAVISDWCSRWGMLVNPSKTRGCLFLIFLWLSICSPTLWLMVLLWRWSLSWRSWVSFSTPSWHLRSKSDQLLPLPRWELAFWGRQWVFFEMSLLLPNASGHLYSLC